MVRAVALHAADDDLLGIASHGKVGSVSDHQNLAVLLGPRDKPTSRL
jgi:hypothetical protein